MVDPKYFPARRVLVAGGAGMLGSALVRELLAMDCSHVVSFDNYCTGSTEYLTGLGSRFTAIRGDLRDFSAIRSTLMEHSIDVLFNCVGDTFVPEAYEQPSRFFEINLGGTLNSLIAAREVGVERLIYVSSTEVYGDVKQMKAIAEDTPLDPVNTYAVSKLSADRLCATFHVEHGTPVMIPRIFNCYGPRATHPYVIPEIISQLSAGSSVRLGNVRAQRDFTFVRDTARALALLAASTHPLGVPVNIGTGKVVDVATLVRLIANILNVPDPVIEVDQSRLRRRDIDWFCCDNSLFVAATGWRPTVTLREGLEETIDWYRCANGWCYEVSARSGVAASLSHRVLHVTPGQ
jgi:nucleoside-diphosphate-sugar epimerase